MDAPDGSEPLVDVVLPTYGPVPYLDIAIESVLAQTDPRWRLTLIDNSPELGEAAAVLARYEHDPRVRRVVTGGLVQHANWTAGMQSGDAPYFAILCDDDWWEPEYLARRIAFLEAHPECGFVFSNYREVDEQGAEIAIRAPRLTAGVHPPAAFAPREYAGNIVPVVTPLHRRSALRAVGEHYKPVRIFDYELWMRLGSRFPVGFLDVRDCAGRLHGGSETSRLREPGRLVLETVDFLDAAVDAADPSLVPAADRRRRRAGAHLTCALDAAEAGNREGALTHLRTALRLSAGSAADPRAATALVLGLAGERGGAALTRMRTFQQRHHVRVHRQDFRDLLDDVRSAVTSRKAQAR